MPWGYVVVHVIIIIFAVGIAWQVSRRPRGGKALAAAVVLIGLPLQAWFLLRPWSVANLLGWADLVFFSELYLPLAAILVTAGVRVQPERSARLRTVGLGALLLLVAGLGGRVPWRPRPTGLEDRAAWLQPAGPQRPWTVVRQTAPSSCGAAAAATLLRARGIDPAASEADLARRCLTDPRQGTSDLGLYRGLARSAPGRTVRFQRPALDELERRAPCLIFVGLTEQVTDPVLFAELRDRCNWDPGVLHAVVLFGFAPGRPHEGARVALIGDPRAGYERWGWTHFVALWQGLTLEIR